jgi:hypothetical protein
MSEENTEILEDGITPDDGKNNDSEVQAIIKKRLAKKDAQHQKEKDQMQNDFNQKLSSLEEKIQSLMNAKKEQPAAEDTPAESASAQHETPAPSAPQPDQKQYLTIDDLDRIEENRKKINTAREVLAKGKEADPEFAELAKTSKNYISPDIVSEIASLHGEKSLPILKKALQDEDFHAALLTKHSDHDWLARKVNAIHKPEDDKEIFEPAVNLRDKGDAASNDDEAENMIRNSLKG